MLNSSLVKADFAESRFQKEVSVTAIFAKDEMIGVIGVTYRWHIKKLIVKTPRGRWKVCIVANIPYNE